MAGTVPKRVANLPALEIAKRQAGARVALVDFTDCQSINTTVYESGQAFAKSLAVGENRVK